MSRALAFVCLALAAFDWTLWPLDRAGWAALGFAFLALAVGRGSGRLRPTIFAPRRSTGADAAFDLEGVIPDLPQRIAAYTDADGS